MSTSLKTLFEIESEKLDEINFIMSDAQITGELTEQQAARLSELEKELIEGQQDIFKKVDAIGYVLTEMQAEMKLAEQWAKNYQAAKKQKEEEINRFKSYIARIMEINNIDSNLKGSIVTIKNITRTERIITDKNLLPEWTKDNVYKIPINEYNKLTNKTKDLLKPFEAKQEVNETRALNADEILPGVEERIKYNTQYWGLNKFSKEVENGK